LATRPVAAATAPCCAWKTALRASPAASLAATSAASAFEDTDSRASAFAVAALTASSAVDCAAAAAVLACSAMALAWTDASPARLAVIDDWRAVRWTS